MPLNFFRRQEFRLDASPEELAAEHISEGWPLCSVMYWAHVLSNVFECCVCLEQKTQVGNLDPPVRHFCSLRLYMKVCREYSFKCARYAGYLL